MRRMAAVTEAAGVPHTCTERRSITMSAETKSKPFPVFGSDEDAERFVDRSDTTHPLIDQYVVNTSSRNPIPAFAIMPP